MSPELNIPALVPEAFTAWLMLSSLTQVIPVPGRTVVAAGTNVLFRMWMILAVTSGVWTGAGVSTTVVSVTGEVTFASIVAFTSAVGSGVAFSVAISVGIAVVSTGTATVVATVVVVVDGAGCVQPVATRKKITKMHNPHILFMKNRFLLLVIKFIELVAPELSLGLTKTGGWQKHP
jgi:hypothetical protein